MKQFYKKNSQYVQKEKKWLKNLLYSIGDAKRTVQLLKHKLQNSSTFQRVSVMRSAKLGGGKQANMHEKQTITHS